MTDHLAGMTDVDLIAMAQGWAESCRDEERASDAEDRLRYRFRAILLEALLARVAENQALRAEVRRLEAGRDAEKARLDWLEAGQGGLSVWAENSPEHRWKAQGYEYKVWGAGRTVRDAIDDAMRKMP